MVVTETRGLTIDQVVRNSAAGAEQKMCGLLVSYASVLTISSATRGV